MFVTAGTMRLPLHRFILADAIAAVAGHSLLFFLAYWGGDAVKTWADVAEAEVQHTIKPLMVLAAIAAVALYLLFHFWKRPVTVGDPKEIPLIGGKVAAKIEQSASKSGVQPCAPRSPEGAMVNADTSANGDRSSAHP